MALADLVPSAAVVDTRAHLRDRHDPSEVTLVALGSGTTEELVNVCLDVRPMPAALVLEDGRAWILTAGGSGMIAFAGESVNDSQRLLVDEITNALVAMGASQPVSLDDEVEPEQEIKPRRRRKADADPTPDVDPEPAPVVEPAAWTVDEATGAPF